MTKQRVQLWGKPQGYAVVDTEATNGAVLGVNILLPDGTLATKEDFAPPIPDVERLQQTVLVNIKEQTRLLVEEQQARDQAVADALLQAAAEAQEKVDAAKALIDAEVDGLQAQLNDFAGQADDWSDQVDYPEGDYVKSGGKLYRALQDVPAGTPLTDTAYWEQLGNYASAGEAISAALVMSTQNASDISAESQRVDTLFTGLGDANAEINTLQQAQSDTEQSLANFVTQTQASFGDVDAQIIAANQARADGDAANALAIQAVQAGLADKADVSVVQTMEAYSTASNLIPDSAFPSDPPNVALATAGGTWSGVVRNLAGSQWKASSANNVGVVAYGALQPGQFSDMYLPVVPVMAGENYGFSCRLAGHRCVNALYVQFLDAGGSNPVGGQIFSSSNTSHGGGLDINNWMLADVVAVAPAGATHAVMVVRTSGTGESDAYSWFCQPQAVNISPLSTRSPVYSVGGREMAARHTVFLDVGGNISGTVSENDGKRSVFSVLADVFRVIASGSVGMEILSRSGGYFMRFYAGAAQIILGINFGQNNNLCLWYGPNVGEANANKGNATVWFDNAGSAYFGGSLSAGVLKNAARSTQISTTAFVEVGPFGTNGRQKNVVFSSAYSVSGTTSSSHNGNVAQVTVRLLRKIGNGSWEQVSSASSSGTATSERDHEQGIWATDLYFGATSTFTDTTTSTQNYSYRAELVNSSGFPIYLTDGTAGSQSLSIVSTEEPS